MVGMPHATRTKSSTAEILRVHAANASLLSSLDGTLLSLLYVHGSQEEVSWWPESVHIYGSDRVHAPFAGMLIPNADDYFICGICL